jgi:hypothetical protein
MIPTCNHHPLTLKQIASWQLPGADHSELAIIAGVPSLQRGAVWDAQQIEFLWDSIMRGFPIGGLVVADKLPSQETKDSLINKQTVKSAFTHHILDGQQRCNAIAWGFADPWLDDVSNDTVLWLDLIPDEQLKNTTRKYLFRVTNKAHPWGFSYTDESNKISSSEIGKFMEELKGISKN